MIQRWNFIFFLLFSLKSINKSWQITDGTISARKTNTNETHSALSERALSRVIDPEPGFRGLPQTSTHNPKPGRPRRQIPSSQGSKAAITKFFSLLVKQKETGTAADREEDGSSLDGGSYLDVARRRSGGKARRRKVAKIPVILTKLRRKVKI